MLQDAISQSRSVDIPRKVFRGKEINLHTHDKVIDAILSADQAVAHLEYEVKSRSQSASEMESLYDGVLGALWDASQIAEAELKPNGASKSQDLSLASGYVSYTRLRFTISRTLFLIEQAMRDVRHANLQGIQSKNTVETIIKLYGTVLLVFITCFDFIIRVWMR